MSLPPLSVTRFDLARDLDALMAVDRASFTSPTSRESIEWEVRHSDVARTYVLRAADEVVGFCATWLVFDELHVNSLAILPPWRGRGLATFLLREVVGRSRGEGATFATLEVRASNVAARALYERFGFRQAGVRRRYYTNPVEDALVLSMDLARSSPDPATAGPPANQSG